MAVEKLTMQAPGRLSVILVEGLRGHHPLFEPDEIRAAFQVPDKPLDALAADQVGQALLAIAREPAHAARGAIDALSPRSRTALIRVYFRLLDRAEEERQLSH
jgi:DNA-directed RNA polymerase specialized sigma24 family protein